MKTQVICSAVKLHHWDMTLRLKESFLNQQRQKCKEAQVAQLKSKTPGFEILIIFYIVELSSMRFSCYISIPSALPPA